MALEKKWLGSLMSELKETLSEGKFSPQASRKNHNRLDQLPNPKVRQPQKFASPKSSPAKPKSSNRLSHNC